MEKICGVLISATLFISGPASAASFNEVFNKVFEPKCIACHGQSGDVNLETYADAKSSLDQIRFAVLDEKRMPKAPFQSLTADEYALIEAWVTAGGPELPPNGEAPPEIPKLEANFESIKTKILVPRCFACHNPDGAASRVILDSVQAMIDSPLEIIVPGNPDESGLMIVVQNGARKPMPPKESAIGPLRDFEVQVLREWIEKGAP